MKSDKTKAPFGSSAHRLLAGSVALMLWLLATPATGGQQMPPGKGKISGRVIAPDGKPLAEAAVSLQEINRHQSLSTVSDAGGKFAFTRLATGLYVAVASKGAYVSGDAEPGDVPIRIQDESELSGLDLHLSKGGVITGRITEESGEPVVMANVELTDPEGQANRGRRFRSAPVFTDDRGVYRFFGLPAGKYLVRVTLAKTVERQLAYTTIYYPGIGSHRYATPVEAVAGTETRDVDFMAKRQPEKGGTISGRITRLDQLPLHDASAWAYTDTSGVRARATVSEDGSYELKDLPAGDYTIDVLTQDPRLIERTRLKVVVSTSKHVEADVAIEPASSISGSFEMEDGTRVRNTAELLITATVESTGQEIPGRIAPDGRFLINRVPSGSVLLSAKVASSPVYVLKMLSDGELLHDGRLSLLSGSQTAGLRVVLSDQGGSLRGTVKQGKNGQPAVGVSVIVVPAEEDRRNDEALARSTRADHRGYFVVEGIAPGRYYVLAYRDFKSLPPSLSQLDSWMVGDAVAASVIEVRARSQQELSLRTVD